MAQSKDKQEKKKETPASCVCGRIPCIVKHKSRHMITCPHTMTCAMRSRWCTNEQAAVIDWNSAVQRAKHERAQKKKKA